MKKICNLFKVTLASTLALTVLTVNPVSVFAKSVDDTGITSRGDGEVTADSGTQELDLNAKVVDTTTDSIKVDLSWGDMEFTYSKDLGVWDFETHTYSNGAVGTWEAFGNNITITNHSNIAVTATAAYTAVGSKALEGSTDVSFSLTNGGTAASEMKLETADSYIDTNNGNAAVAHLVEINDADFDDNARTTARRKDFFVTLSNDPGSNAKVDYATMSKAGTITVTITKDTARQDQYGR